MRPGEPNVGLKLHAEEVGKGILEREMDETISYGVLDPSAFKEDGGPSFAERIARGAGGKVWFHHADNTRIPARGAMGGWDQMRSTLNEKKGHVATSITCPYTLAGEAGQDGRLREAVSAPNGEIGRLYLYGVFDRRPPYRLSDDIAAPQSR
jgi:hypothetical protein